MSSPAPFAPIAELLERSLSIRAARENRMTWLRVMVACALLVNGAVAGIVAAQSQEGSAEVFLKRGEDFATAHDYARAIADYNTAIQLKPDYAEAYNDRGFAYYLQGNGERAIADFTRAIELRPNYPKAYNSRGVMYMAGGYGSAKAVADFDRAIALKPDFRYAYINRANARLVRHPWLALADFHRAGMYPERRVALFVGAVLLAVAAIAMVSRKRKAQRKLT